MFLISVSNSAQFSQVETFGGDKGAGKQATKTTPTDLTVSVQAAKSTQQQLQGVRRITASQWKAEVSEPRSIFIVVHLYQDRYRLLLQ
jgi:hypothetical protein